MRGSDGSPRWVETALRRSIPVLILAFLVVVAAARLTGILSEYGRMESAIRQSAALSAATAAAALAPQCRDV